MTTVLDRTIRPQRSDILRKQGREDSSRPAQTRSGCACARPALPGYNATRQIVKDNGLVTVCEEAACPNIGECWSEVARDDDDHGGDLHPRLRVLQRRDGTCPTLWIPTEPARVGHAVKPLWVSSTW